MELSLDGTRVSDHGGVRLARLPNLFFVSLKYTSVTSRSVQVLLGSNHEMMINR